MATLSKKALVNSFDLCETSDSNILNPFQIKNRKNNSVVNKIPLGGPEYLFSMWFISDYSLN